VKVAAVFGKATFVQAGMPPAEIIDGMTGTQRLCSRETTARQEMSALPDMTQHWPAAALRLHLDLPPGSAGTHLELRLPAGLGFGEVLVEELEPCLPLFGPS
jgi:hypothetical protein